MARKQYTFEATIIKKEPTEKSRMIEDQVLQLYIDKLLEINRKQNEKLVEN